MPSPRCPSRAITSRSTTLRLDEKLAIAVAAHAPPACGDEFFDVGTDRGVNFGIAHDSLLDRAAPRFELRLDQRDQGCARFEKRFHGRQHELERDETRIDGG